MLRLPSVTGVQISLRLREASCSRPSGLLTPGVCVCVYVCVCVARHKGGSIQIPQKFQLKEKVDEGVEIETGRVCSSRVPFIDCLKEKSYSPGKVPEN